MRQITILSGKGGTGKTSLTAAFASLAENVVLADCDVDAADLHLICKPTLREKQPFQSGYELVFDAERCNGCGLCEQVCRFEAVDTSDGKPSFDPFACEACGCCVDICARGALKLVDAIVGEMRVSDTQYGPMVHARLDPGAENSGKLVAAVRHRAAEIGRAEGRDLLLADGPPGIGCPVIASLSGADGVLAVTEPSLSALHDLTRVIDLAEHFKIPAAVVINKADLAPKLTDRIESLCNERNAPVIGRIPFDRTFVDALVAGRNILEHPTCNPHLAETIRQTWHTALATLCGEKA